MIPLPAIRTDSWSLLTPGLWVQHSPKDSPSTEILTPLLRCLHLDPTREALRSPFIQSDLTGSGSGHTGPLVSLRGTDQQAACPSAYPPIQCIRSEPIGFLGLCRHYARTLSSSPNLVEGGIYLVKVPVPFQRRTKL